MIELSCDVAVIGGGAAGCAAAARAARVPGASVVLLEAGPDYGADPQGWPPDLLDVHRVPLSHDWGYAESLPDGRHSPAARAKVLGGCSSHNECAAVWGLPSDYDRWADAVGDRRWSYGELRPLFDEIEDTAEPSPYRGSGGRVWTRRYGEDELSAWQRAFLHASSEAGHRRAADLSDPTVDGAAVLHANVVGLRRWNSAFAFLGDPRPPGVAVVDRTTVDRLVLRGDEAVAVVGQREDGTPVRVEAGVYLLTAGAFGSPAVLLRSGIGPAAELQRLGVPLVHDVPGVGQGLQDHVGVPLRVALTAEAERELLDEVAAGRHFQSQVVSRLPDPAAPGRFFHVLPYQAPNLSYRAAAAEQWETTAIVYVMNPASRGSVTLADRSLEAASLRIDVGYLSDAEGTDAAALQRGVALVRELLGQPALSSLVTDELTRTGTQEELDTFIRANRISYAHHSCTCRIGADDDPGAVADPTGRVRGTANVFVADASAFPQTIGANTNLTCMLLGWMVCALAIGRGGPVGRSERVP